MNQHSMSKFLATVLVSFVSFGAWAQGNTPALATATSGATPAATRATTGTPAVTGAAAAAATGPTIIGGKTEAQIAQEDRQACDKVRADYHQAKAESIRYCKRLSKNTKDTESCANEIDACSDLREEEVEDLAGSIMGMPIASMDKKCSMYSREKLDQMIEKMEDQLDTKNRNIRDIKKDQTKDEESYADRIALLSEEISKLKEERAKEQAEDKENEKMETMSIQEETQEIESALRKLNTEIYKSQQQQALLTSQRGNEVNGYRLAMLECRAKVRELQKRSYGNTA
jgi:chromosome segregation ATPase